MPANCDRRSVIPVDLRRQVDLLPDEPGVYQFFDSAGGLLYVGKAGSLRQRVRSYFQASRDLRPRKEAMAAEIAGLDHIVTGSTVEALILESNLIKRHHPRYNVRLRDDKQYPYLRIGLDEEFPGVTLVRSRGNDGARYFGPYTRTHLLRATLRTVRRVFPYRTCRRVVPRQRPCLNYFIGRCLAPCIGKVSAAEYREAVDGLVLFFSGRGEEVARRLERQMREAADAMDYERAAAYRDQLRALGSIIEGQRVVTKSLVDRDVIAAAASAVGACAQAFFFRRGRLVGRETFWLKGAEGSGGGEALGAFVAQFYAAAAEIPKEVLLSEEVEDREVVEDWLSGIRGAKVRVKVPRRGEPAALVALALKNARQALEERSRLRGSDESKVAEDLWDLAQALELDDYPARIECYDISNFGGHDAVASMVVFEDGLPKKEDYRHFRIRTPGPDDYGMLAEVLRRRFRRGRTGRPADDRNVATDSFAVLPDLIVVDGGRGQAEAAAAAVAGEGLAGMIPVFGLAKRREILYPAGGGTPIALEQGSGALFTLIRLRDEAHRFALRYHRKLRSRRALKSTLDEIPGIGPVRRTLLLRHFGSGRAIAAATLEQLKAVPGLPEAVAGAVYEKLHKRQAVEADGPEERDDPTNDGKASGQGGK